MMRVLPRHAETGTQPSRQASRVLFPVAIGLAALLTALRLAMGLTLHVWVAANGFYDDYLLISYSLPDYGSRVGNPVKMAKNQAMGLFYRVVHASGLPVGVWFFLAWLAAALLVALALRRLFGNRWLALCSYLYVLWNPLAFDSYTGTRLYRNSLFAPAYFALIALLAIILTAQSAVRRAAATAFDVAAALALGVVAFLVYDFKEDSVAMIPLVAAVLAIKAVMCLREHAGAGRKAASLLICCALPMGVAAGGVAAVRGYNAAHFGVALLNTRCAGQIGGFVYRLYAIDSPDRTSLVWAPADSLEQAWAASPTLRTNPGLLEDIEQSNVLIPGGEDLKSHPLQGDLISWQIMVAVEEAWGGDEAAIEEYFARVNEEIDQAFADGTLRHPADTVQPVASLPPRTASQIHGVLGLAAEGYWCYLTLGSRYDPGEQLTPPGDMEPAGAPEGVVTDLAALLSQVNIDPADPNATPFPSFTPAAASGIASFLAVCYRCANILLLAVLVAAVVLSVIAARRRRDLFPLSMSALALCLLAYGFAYALAVAWYCYEVIDIPGDDGWLSGMFYDGAGIVTPFLVFALLMGVGVLCRQAGAAGVRKAPGTVGADGEAAWPARRA